MKRIIGWSWLHQHIPIEERMKVKNQAKIISVDLINRDFPFDRFCKHDTVFVTGDGHTLPQDVKKFESWNIPHDLFCVNRSMIFFERPVTHWAAVDTDEAVWFSENVNEKIMPEGHRIVRHTIGKLLVGADVYWEPINFAEPITPVTGVPRRIWTGNSGLLAILSSIYMGYKKIVLAGIPLDTKQHWYEPEGTEGPNWVGMVYRQWMDFKIEIPEAENVRSLSGYSAFILGKPTKEWLNGG